VDGADEPHIDDVVGRCPAVVAAAERPIVPFGVGATDGVDDVLPILVLVIVEVDDGRVGPISNHQKSEMMIKAKSADS
jgi:hypothetical protein